jgi:predicted phage terminase large subunit-like protein
MGRVPPTQLVQKMVGMYAKYRPSVLVSEQNGFQQLLAGVWRDAADQAGLIGVECEEFIASGDKICRIESAITPLMARGMLRFRTGSQHNEQVVNQLKAIPNGDHDDGPDAISIALSAINNHQAGRLRRDPFGGNVYERAL